MKLDNSLVSTDIASLSTKLCRRLWIMYSKPGSLDTLLLVPQYATDLPTSRFSEQEARFALVQILNEEYIKSGSPIYYSVETPTTGKHNFQKKLAPTPDAALGTPGGSIGDDNGAKKIRKRSGQIDMSLYRSRENGIPLFCNVEFKIGVKDEQKIYQDILKLSCEQRSQAPCESGWLFHVIGAAEKQTFMSLHKYCTGALRRHASELKTGERADIVLTYCVLKDRKPPLRPSWSATAVVCLHGGLADQERSKHDPLAWMSAETPFDSAVTGGWICDSYTP